MDQDKRRLRKLKRDLKKAGNKTRRQRLKRDLTDNPQEAHWTEATVGHRSSAWLNRLDEDATRRPRHEK